jgi:malonyl-CoA/methylmalonyl-CoA synthetase
LPVTRNSNWQAHLPPGVDPGGLDLLAARSLPATWRRLAAADPDRPALWAAGPGWRSRGELDVASARVAGRFQRAGLAAGDRVLVSAATSMDLVVAYLGALRMGLVVVPVNTTYREREVAHIVGDARPRAAVVDDPERGAWARRAAGGDLLVTGPEAGLPDGDPPPLDTAAPPSSATPRALPAPPRGPCWPTATCWPAPRRSAWPGAGTRRTGWCWPCPCSTIHGLGVGLHGTLLAGASAVLLPRFEADAVLDVARDHRATLFFGVPTMYTRLAASPRAAELGRLRLCVSGPAPLPPTVFERLAERAGQRVLERYGMTETIMNVSNPHDGERRPGTVGLPLPGVELRLAGGGSGRGSAARPQRVLRLLGQPGGDGRGLRRRRLVPHRRPRQLRRAWISADRGPQQGADHHRRLQRPPPRGRGAAARAPWVGRGGRCRDPSEEWGEQVTAFVVPTDPGAPPGRDELLAFAAERLAGFKRPRLVHYVEALPRNALGKVLKHELRP